MCRIVVRNERPKGQSAPRDGSDWKPYYANYVWLCGIKHPTLAQTIHDAGATSDGKGGYAVMALPDTREENLDVKKSVCHGAISSTLWAITAFGKGAGIPLTSEEGKRFVEKTEKIREILSDLLRSKPALKLPFTIQNSTWARKQMAKHSKGSQKPNLNSPPASPARNSPQNQT